MKRKEKKRKKKMKMKKMRKNKSLFIVNELKLLDYLQLNNIIRFIHIYNQIIVIFI